MYNLPDLDYSYDAFGPYISAAIMKLHHSQHHQTYVDKLNAALDKAPELKERSLEELITKVDTLPEHIAVDVRSAIRNHGGGHLNHSLFWKMMSPDGGSEPTGALAQALALQYGDFQGFMDAFTEKATGVFGSGWTWLQPDLSIVTTANQDSPLTFGGPAPLLGLDVWEHAYYLDYTFKRADYIKAWWHVVNWHEVERRFESTEDSSKSQ